MAKVDDFIHFPEAPNPPVFIQYKGIMDMQDLYESTAEFFRRKKFKFYEVQQRLRRPGPFGAEILYQFKATREIEEYYEWIVDIIIETFDMHDVEVVTRDGIKKKMTKGRIWIYIAGKVEMDHSKIFEKSAFMAHIRSFYHKYVIKKKIEGIWGDELYYKIVLKLHSVIKERLKMASEGFEARHMGGVH